MISRLHIHPDQRRGLTCRELARIQSFPDKFQFPVSRMDQHRMIGGAVPPLLAKRIGHGIINLLTTTKGKPDDKKSLKCSGSCNFV